MDVKRSCARFGALVTGLMLFADGGALGLDLPNPFGLFGGGKDAESKGAPPPPPSGALGIDCPEILVDTGTASLRVPAGAENSSVRYQLSLGDMARECSIEGDRILIKVGVEGAAVLGPSGAPGSYSGTLRISARRQKNEDIIDSKSYRVSATIASGATRGEFRVISDALAVPYLGPQAADDYEILVGFEGGGEREAPAAPKRRKRRAGATAASPD